MKSSFVFMCGGIFATLLCAGLASNGPLGEARELQPACEATLPRDQHCKMVYIPVTQDMEEVTK